MTRTLRTQLADMAEHHIRFGRSYVSRERAADLLSDWDAFKVDDDLLSEVLSRFPASEPPAVPGFDFLAVEQDAKTIVAETLAGSAAVWDDSVPPGGFVCSVCRTPVESEPCELHGAGRAS